MAKKVLIIDDDEIIVKYLKKLLNDNGYETSVAGNGREGMELIKTEKPDLIILDVMMETMFSGFEVCRKVKSDNDLKKIPIIGVSGMADEIDVRFNPAGDAEYFSPDEFLEKPVNQELLLNKIEKLL